jgi:hypothetical protein
LRVGGRLHRSVNVLFGGVGYLSQYFSGGRFVDRDALT